MSSAQVLQQKSKSSKKHR